MPHAAPADPHASRIARPKQPVAPSHPRTVNNRPSGLDRRVRVSGPAPLNGVGEQRQKRQGISSGAAQLRNRGIQISVDPDKDRLHYHAASDATRPRDCSFTLLTSRCLNNRASRCSASSSSRSSNRATATGPFFRYRCKLRYFEDRGHHQPRSHVRLRPTMCRANGSPTCARSPGPSGRPGSSRADGTLSSPRPVSDPTPTATTPGAKQPLQEPTPPASRTPPIHVRSNEGQGRIPQALRKAQAAPRDHEGGSSRRVLRTRRGCNPIRYRSGYRHSRGIRVVHAGSTTINSTPRRRHCRSSAAIAWRERKFERMLPKRFPYCPSKALLVRKPRSSATTGTPRAAAGSQIDCTATCTLLRSAPSSSRPTPASLPSPDTSATARWSLFTSTPTAPSAWSETMAWRPDPIGAGRQAEMLQTALQHPKERVESQPDLALTNSMLDQTPDHRSLTRGSHRKDFLPEIVPLGDIGVWYGDGREEISRFQQNKVGNFVNSLSVYDLVWT